MARQPRQHGESSQQVGAPHHVRHGFREYGVKRPHRSHQPRGGDFAKNPERQQVDQRDIDSVQSEVHPVIHPAG